jgi:hypothetical protein
MAYVVTRPKGRFEIRESVHTPKGPRARSLANFARFSDDVLELARKRASRPFDCEAVRAAAQRAAARPDAPGRPPVAEAAATATVPGHAQPETRRFVEATRRMAATLETRPPQPGSRRDPGDALLDLFDFLALSAASRPPRPPEPLQFPPLSAPTRRAPSRRRAAREPTPTGTGRNAQLGADLGPKIISLHEMIDSAGIPHQFGGAIALAWYRNPRATTDIDINFTVPPAAAAPVLGLLAHLGVTVTEEDREAIDRDGQARLDWAGSYLDVFFATTDLHLEMAERARTVRFGPLDIPILAPEHLIVCKVVFDRPKDWLDIEEMVRWGTTIDAASTLGWIALILGDRSPQWTRLERLLG